MAGDGIGDFIGGVPIGAAIHPGRLIGWIIGHFVLEEVGLSAVPVTDNLVLLVMFNEQAIGSHIIAVHDQTIGGSIRGPANPASVVRAPQPEVVQDDIIAIHHQALCCLSDRRAADPEKDIAQHRRVSRVILGRTGRADLEQNGRIDCTCSEENARDRHSIDIGNGHGDDTILWYKGSQAETEDDRIRPCHLECAGEGIDAGCEQQIQPLRERVIQCGRGIAGLRDVELADGQGCPGGRTVAPANAL